MKTITIHNPNFSYNSDEILGAFNYINDRFRTGKNLTIDHDEQTLKFRCNPELVKLLAKSIRKQFKVIIYF